MNQMKRYTNVFDRKEISAKEKQYLKIYSIDKVNSFCAIEENENIRNEQKDGSLAKNMYRSVWHYIGTKIGLSEAQVKKIYDKLKPEIGDIQYVFQQFKSERKEGFGDFATFYDWYAKQPRECFYCKTKEERIIPLFRKKLLKSAHPGWNTGGLQIERKDGKEYTESNCVLACLFCNNAKSDLISSKDFKKYIAKGFKAYLKSFYNRNREILQ